ncbi:MAG: helix-turn-helix domain-containing protein [Arthrobacter sp.]|jgi:DNA-binding transcriptional ArsR family regulator|nr:helix-turn-helix domain-containing protein [Arthrobacter sp.]
MSTSERPAESLRLDARALKVLAHPLRSRLLSQLRINGPATATELAAALGTNSGATSYHLRELEGVGLVRDTREGQGRRREWAAATASHSWSDAELRDTPDARAALTWLRQHYSHQFSEQMQRWNEAKDAWSDEWVDVLGLSDTLVTVTPEQAAQLHAELDEVLARYREIGAGDPRAIRSQVHVHVAPLDPFAVPENP